MHLNVTPLLRPPGPGFPALRRLLGFGYHIPLFYRFTIVTIIFYFFRFVKVKFLQAAVHGGSGLNKFVMGRTCGQFIHHKISSGGIQFFQVAHLQRHHQLRALKSLQPGHQQHHRRATDTSATSWLVRRVEVTISASVRRPSIQ